MAPATSLDSRSPAKTNKLWDVVPIPGKGKGLLAVKDLAPGTLVLSEAPLLAFDDQTSEKDLFAALKKLPKESQRSFLSLHNNWKRSKDICTGIIRSNAYPLDDRVGGLFPDIARMNHSCLANCYHSWNNNLGRETVYSVRPIAKGEELTLSYIPGGSTFKERKQHLKKYFCFQCHCELCSLPLHKRQESDARLIRAQHLHRTIGESKTCRYLEKVLKNGYQLMKIYRDEDVKDDRVPNLYFDMFQVCNMHSDQARASCFARMYCDAKLLSCGPESVAYQDMEPFIAKPDSHESFASTKGWESKVSDIPQDLDAEQFEKWIWRETSP